MSRKINNIMYLHGSGDVAELAYARDLKFLAHRACGFESHRPYFFCNYRCKKPQAMVLLSCQRRAANA